MPTLLSLLRHVSWADLRHHGWRNLVAVLAVVLGVALAFSVHLINESALGEFSSAVRSVNGQPDFELRAQKDGFDESLYARVAAHPNVAVASPVIELDAVAFNPRGERVVLRVLGVDALVVAALAPDLMPQPSAGQPRLAMLEPDGLFLNEAARLKLEAAGSGGEDVQLQAGMTAITLPWRGRVAAGGAPLAVMDLAGAQANFGFLGRLSRIDVRLVPGADRDEVLRQLALPAGVRAAAPDEAALRVSNMSRAYRVNLTVLALVALFTGGFLVFSILSLSVARRLPQLALLGVLGLSGRERMAWVLAESALLGLVGSVLGLALGAALAQLALTLLAGDLGGGYFPGVAPTLRLGFGAAVVYGGLGMGVAVLGGWWPARMAQHMAPAQAIKGLGQAPSGGGMAWAGPALLGLGVVLAFLPPWRELPLAAYASVACLLFGGIACVPAGVGALLRVVPPPRHALALLAVERTRHQRHSATIAVAGVVASLALSVALTVMVGSFRDSITSWLDTILPADLYARTASSSAGDTAFLSREWLREVAALPGVARVEAQRVVSVQIDPARPAVVVIAKPLPDPARALPLVGTLVSRPALEAGASRRAPGSGSAGSAGSLTLPPANAPDVFVSEAMVTLYQAQPGTWFDLPLPNGQRQTVWVRGVWRDYARQGGAVMLDAGDYERLTGDTRVNDLAIWVTPGTVMGELQANISALAPTVAPAGAPPGSAARAATIDFAQPGEIRAISLRIFDRSFAVTYWLQAVAIAIGLFGIAASFSAQVLSRRKEFGLLAHLGLTRRQILTLIAAEGAVWTAAGTLLGLALGLAVSVVLVKVVNPQSFHWTMDIILPWARLTALCLAVLAAGIVTAWMSGRAAAGKNVALAVKEDW